MFNFRALTSLLKYFNNECFSKYGNNELPECTSDSWSTTCTVAGGCSGGGDVPVQMVHVIALVWTIVALVWTVDEPARTIDEFVRIIVALVRTVDELVQRVNQLPQMVDELAQTVDELLRTVDKLVWAVDELAQWMLDMLENVRVMVTWAGAYAGGFPWFPETP